MELTNEEKKAILDQHIKGIVVNKYNLHIAIIAESAAEVRDEANIALLNQKMEAEQAKYDALLVEYTTLTDQG